MNVYNIYICMYIHMYIRIYPYVYIYMHVLVFVHVYLDQLCICILIVYVFVYIRMYMYMYVYTQINTHSCKAMVTRFLQTAAFMLLEASVGSCMEHPCGCGSGGFDIIHGHDWLVGPAVIQLASMNKRADASANKPEPPMHLFPEFLPKLSDVASFGVLYQRC